MRTKKTIMNYLLKSKCFQLVLHETCENQKEGNWILRSELQSLAVVARYVLLKDYTCKQWKFGNISSFLSSAKRKRFHCLPECKSPLVSVNDKAEIVLRWNKYIEIISFIVRGQEEHNKWRYRISQHYLLTRLYYKYILKHV